METNITFDRIGNGKLTYSDDFITTFPKLFSLLKTAHVLDFTINSNKRYRQYIWRLINNKTCGWLCQLEHVFPQHLNLIPEHILLTKTMGGIINYWGGDDFNETLLYANNFLFGIQNSTNSFEWADNYLEACELESLLPLSLADLLTFSQESNGNNTFYHKETKEVFLYAHDGYSPLDITLKADQPKYTIYTYDNIITFNDYVETLAEQWLDNIDSRKPNEQRK
ncbi:hypothetical protein [Fibrella aquatilis]|uniref:Uncharacterized protein n=1 Tax=Fibrella aquatilis TaxID=2817059 RepID=A0A939G0K7_9BACT|nr:hypothetical protein [Fibrella aquatilis]MBO0929656.1 hypothetical protein [Fibrella aquatilis]